MALKDYKKQIVKPNRILFTKGKFRPGFGYADWIHIDKERNSFAQKIEDINKIIYNVGAKNKINTKEVNGRSRIFKTRTAALNFAKAYMRTH